MLMLATLVVVPNMFFLAVMPLYIAERLISPLFYLVAGFLAFFLPPAAAYLVFGAAALADLGLILLIAFHLPLATALDSLRYLSTIDVGSSILYVAIIGIVLATTALTAWLFNRYRVSFRGASPLPTALAAFAIVATDFFINVPYFVRNEPTFESAIAQTAMHPDAIASRGNNLMIVMVEGLGAFADPRERQILSDKLARIAHGGRYTLETGVTSYVGSTTGAASRELCGKWGDYLDYLKGGAVDCLPRQMASRGFDTVAFHGFSHTMFARDIWYPKIGFTELNFFEDMVSRNSRDVPSRCGSVFEGLCDAEVGDLVGARLKAEAERPKLVYWLTLNSHIPYVAAPHGSLECQAPGAAIGNSTVCELTELWGEIFDKVAEIAGDPLLPATDILVVGDHHTPLWERSAKKRFTLGKVDWYLLRSTETRPEQIVAARLSQAPLRP